MDYNEEEQFQLEWIKNHRMEDKDEQMKLAKEEEAKANPKQNLRGKNMRRSPSAWELPVPEDEIDLHGFTADEAAEAVERRIDDLLIAGFTVLRVIHGGGNPEYGNVKHIIDRKVRSEWKNKVLFYKTEPDNAGSSIMKIGKPKPQIVKKKKK
ncbi:MAG: Smr/MutS family protein [Fibrobacter sp.]|uniref:Smr/MutS family protein n=1 Tax=Fibrobacter sp. TaxID=35828 RepID=UPI00389053A9|nr:Smr/MutS family protein [Fibrobacter sp.]